MAGRMEDIEERRRREAEEAKVWQGWQKNEKGHFYSRKFRATIFKTKGNEWYIPRWKFCVGGIFGTSGHVTPEFAKGALSDWLSARGIDTPEKLTEYIRKYGPPKKV